MRTRKEWRGAVIGMVMGDGSMWRNCLRNGEPTGDYKFSLTHSLKQAQYLEHKKKIINDIFNYEIPTRRKENLASNGKLYPVVRFDSRTHKRISFIAKRVYVDGKKRITDFSLKNITDEGFACWWMDDGCLFIDKRPNHGGGICILATNGFPLSDVEKLRDWIFQRYGVMFRVYRHIKSGYTLRRGISGAWKMLDTLKQYSVPCMDYKFDWEDSIKGSPYVLSV